MTLEFKTTIENDPDHKALCRRAIEAIRGGLKWRHHGIGVLQAYVSEGDNVEHRLHIWSRSLLKQGIDVSGDVHDHRFDMVSHVLFGAIFQEEWLLQEDPLGTYTTMSLVNARAAGAEHNYHAPMKPTGIRYKPHTSYTLVRAGNLYRFPARQFHRTPPCEFSITWVEKHNQMNMPARIAHPIDIPAVPAFGHDIDLSQVKHLEQLAISVLTTEKQDER